MNITFNYLFSHEYLKEIILEQPVFFLEVLSHGRDKSEDFINTFWRMCAEKAENIELPSNDSYVDVDSFEYMEDNYLLLLKLPNNNVIGECLMLGITFSFNNTFLRYFTYENINNDTFLCEWTTMKNHVVHAQHDEYDPEQFEKDIVKILLK